MRNSIFRFGLLEAVSALMVLLFACGCPKSEPPAPNPAPSAPPAKPAPKADPVAEHWTVTGEQALAGKRCETWWTTSGSSAQVLDTIGTSVQHAWPKSGLTPMGDDRLAYSIPLGADVFGGERTAHVSVGVAPTDAGTTRVTYEAVLTAEDQVEAEAVVRAEAERLYGATESGQSPVSDPPGTEVGSDSRFQIPAARYRHNLRDGLPDYGFPSAILNDLKPPFDGCRYGNPFTSDSRTQHEGEMLAAAYKGPDQGSMSVQFPYDVQMTPDPENQVFMLDNESRRLNVRLTFRNGMCTIENPEVLKNVPPPWRLYRTFTFPAALADLKQHGAIKEGKTRKLAILVHGWNPPDPKYLGTTAALPNPFAFPPWDQLERNLISMLPPDWSLSEYDWSADAATGPIMVGDEKGFDGLRNGCEAAVIGYLHGEHLGELLREKCPGVTQVHFMAHSAGSWVAYSAARYLLANLPHVQLQVTLLDPFMPAQSGYPGGVLGKKEMDSLPFKESTFTPWSQAQLYRLENYYVSDRGTGAGTSQSFSWRADTVDINQSLDSMEYDASDEGLKAMAAMAASESTPPLIPHPSGYSATGFRFIGHDIPICYYADSVAEKVSSPMLSKFGWPLSMEQQN